MRYRLSSRELLRICAGMLLLSMVACNKRLPGEIPCGCDTDTVYKKGRLAVCGTLYLPIDSTMNNIVVVSAYTGQVPNGTYAPAELGSNKNIPFFRSSALNIQSIGWRFSVDASIKDLKGNLLIQIMDNKWFVYASNISKYNYDAKGLEVFDKLGRVAFSVTLGTYIPLYKYSLNIQGIVPMADSTVDYWIANNYFLPFRYGTPALDSVIDMYYRQWPIQPLFRYTGPNWQHARVGTGGGL